MNNLDFKIFDKDLWFFIESDQWKATIIHKLICSWKWSWFSNCDLSSKAGDKERYAIMQYIWLNDINWIKIYASDLVSIPWSDHKYEVVYDNNSASYWLLSLKTDRQQISTLWFSLVVVWNKYNLN